MEYKNNNYQNNNKGEESISISLINFGKKFNNYLF